MASIDENGATPENQGVAAEGSAPAHGASDVQDPASLGAAPPVEEGPSDDPPADGAAPPSEEPAAPVAEAPVVEAPPAVEAEAPAAAPEPAAEAPASEPAAESEAPVEAIAAEPAAEGEAVAAEPVADGEPVAEGEAPDDGAMPEEAPRAIDGNNPLEVARALREAIVEEAERLRASTAWSKTSQAFRDLLDRWKAAGTAGREIDQSLWARFSTARDEFHEARNKHYAERSRLASAAIEAKKTIVAETEQLLETADPRKIGDGLDRLMASWKEAGHAGSEEAQLWQAFRAARDRAFTARRELAAARDRARTEIKAAKETLISEAEALAEVREVQELEAALERQMEAWRHSGSAGRKLDDELWERFRAARGAAFARLRGMRQRHERQRDGARQSLNDVVNDAMRLAYTDSPVREQDLARYERAWEKVGENASEEQRTQWAEVVGRLRERVAKPQPTAQSSAGSLLLAKQEEIVRRLEERAEGLRGDEDRERELRRAESQLVEERAKLERMSALLGAASRRCAREHARGDRVRRPLARGVRRARRARGSRGRGVRGRARRSARAAAQLHPLRDRGRRGGSGRRPRAAR